jgi:hypothetical protein
MTISGRTTQRGSSMVLTLLITFSIIALGVAGLLSARSGLTLSNNYKTGMQAMHTGESGIVHSLSNINGYGVRSFQDDVAPSAQWSVIFGTAPKQITGYNQLAYTVVPKTTPAATKNNMWVTAVGQAPGESTRTIDARLGFIGPFTCGAIDMPSTGVSSNFNGQAFTVDGNDYPLGSSTPNPSLPTTLGISTRQQSDANTVLSSLNNNQDGRVLGTPVPNQIASVATCMGPSTSRIRNSLIPTMLAQPSPPVVTDPVNRTNINGNVTLGTVNNPQITNFTGAATIKANGNASGAGILIVDGGLTIQGNFSFTGLIIVDGTTQITTVTGNATVYGAIWTTDLSLTVGGSAAVLYSSGALALASSIPGTTQQILPQRAAVIAWSML